MPRFVFIRRCLAVGALALMPGCASWEHERSELNRSQKPATSDVVWQSNFNSPEPTLIQPVAGQQELKPKDRFSLPQGLPGAEAEPIKLPSLKDLSREEREKIVREAYPALAALEETPKPALPESGKPLTLAELQALAIDQNPAIRRAAADAEVAYGAMIQAGLYPNPNVGWQADQMQPGPKVSNNMGQQGAFIQQLIKTAGKLSLARAAAGMEYANAQVAMRRAQLNVLTHVRSAWFNVLMARETMLVSRQLAELTDDAYRLQLRQVASGVAAGYEPLQHYSQAVQARNIHIQARNRYLGAWRQLAAALGTPEMPLTELDGRVEPDVPRFDPELARQRVLESHTDILTAQNEILQAQYQLRRAQVAPIPDLSTNTVVQHDNSTGNPQFSLQLGIALPVFDRNQGNIRSAKATLARAQEDLRVKQNDLSAKLAEAMARYQSQKAVVANIRRGVLPNLTRAYRGIRQRYDQEPDKVGFNDIIVAQQNLGQATTSYLTSLGDLWTAVIDVADLLQIDNLYAPLPEKPFLP